MNILSVNFIKYDSLNKILPCFLDHDELQKLTMEKKDYHIYIEMTIKTFFGLRTARLRITDLKIDQYELFACKHDTVTHKINILARSQI